VGEQVHILSLLLVLFCCLAPLPAEGVVVTMEEAVAMALEQNHVVADVSGEIEAPVYAILQMRKEIGALSNPDGTPMEVLASRQPWSEEKLGMKWDGEWHITYEVFRDLGIAFAAVMVLICILVVAWFRDFTTPLVIMAPIPLTLIGILPGHALFGAFFTATSMIGFIAWPASSCATPSPSSISPR